MGINFEEESIPMFQAEEKLGGDGLVDRQVGRLTYSEVYPSFLPSSSTSTLLLSTLSPLRMYTH